MPHSTDLFVMGMCVSPAWLIVDCCMPFHHASAAMKWIARLLRRHLGYQFCIENSTPLIALILYSMPNRLVVGGEIPFHATTHVTNVLVLNFWHKIKHFEQILHRTLRESLMQLVNHFTVISTKGIHDGGLCTIKLVITTFYCFSHSFLFWQSVQLKYEILN